MDPIPKPEAHILKMETSAVEALRFMGHVLNEHGLYESDLEDFLRHFKVVDLLDLIDLSHEPYQNMASSFEDDGLQRLVPFLVDLKLFVNYLYENADFEGILRQSEHKVPAAWNIIMEDEKRHKRRYARYRDLHRKGQLAEHKMDNIDEDTQEDVEQKPKAVSSDEQKTTLTTESPKRRVTTDVSRCGPYAWTLRIRTSLSIHKLF
jgi:hypothetical protein